jgi:hypothetical protein
MATPPRQVEFSVYTRDIPEIDEDVVYIDSDHPGWPQRHKPDSVSFDDDAESGI